MGTSLDGMAITVTKYPGPFGYLMICFHSSSVGSRVMVIANVETIKFATDGAEDCSGK